MQKIKQKEQEDESEKMAEHRIEFCRTVNWHKWLKVICILCWRTNIVVVVVVSSFLRMLPFLSHSPGTHTSVQPHWSKWACCKMRLCRCRWAFTVDLYGYARGCMRDRRMVWKENVRKKEETTTVFVPYYKCFLL